MFGVRHSDVKTRHAVSGGTPNPPTMSLDDRTRYGQTQAGVAWASFPPCRVSAIEPVEDFVNVFRINRGPIVLDGQGHLIGRLDNPDGDIVAFGGIAQSVG